MEAIPGKHSVDSLQEAAVLGTSHIIREVLQFETGILSGGDRHWFKRSTREKRTMTGDDDDDNNNKMTIIIIIIIIIPYNIIQRTCNVKLIALPVIMSFRPHYGLRVDSAGNRNEYQEYFLGVKAAAAKGRQPYHLLVPIFLKSGSLSLVEPSGPVQACNGIALLLPVIIWSVGTISLSFGQYLKNIPGNHDMKGLQQTAIVDTAHVLREVQM